MTQNRPNRTMSTNSMSGRMVQYSSSDVWRKLFQGYCKCFQRFQMLLSPFVFKVTRAEKSSEQVKPVVSKFSGSLLCRTKFAGLHQLKTKTNNFETCQSWKLWSPKHLRHTVFGDTRKSKHFETKCFESLLASLKQKTHFLFISTFHNLEWLGVLCFSTVKSQCFPAVLED